ncbi:MAG: OsmC family protein [Chitinophagaceae bacterium]
MNADELKAMQAPLKEKYKGDPPSAVILLKASGTLGEGLSCSVDTGRALVKAGLHPATGGTGLLACSGDMLLQALVACAGVTLQAVATAIGVTIREGLIEAEGELDFKGTLGVSKEVPVGFSRIRLAFKLDTDAGADQLASLSKLTERYCVVYQTLIKGVPIETKFS